MNTHYGVICFSGDLDDDHPALELRGTEPSIRQIAAGPEQFCWDSLAVWIAKHPLRRNEWAEVLLRDPAIVEAPKLFTQEDQ